MVGNNLHTRTLQAVERACNGYVVTVDDGVILVRDDMGDYSNTIAELHHVDGGWMHASWSSRNNQWQSSDVPRAEQSFRYAYGPTLASLAGVGVKVHRSAADAARSAILAYEGPSPYRSA